MRTKSYKASIPPDSQLGVFIHIPFTQEPLRKATVAMASMVAKTVAKKVLGETAKNKFGEQVRQGETATKCHANSDKGPILRERPRY